MIVGDQQQESPMTTVWTLTYDGDNCPITTEVFATEAEAYAQLRKYIQDNDNGKSLPSELAALPNDQLCEIWTEQMDGACMVESHTV
jgi:hypothetical protein